MLLIPHKILAIAILFLLVSTPGWSPAAESNEFGYASYQPAAADIKWELFGLLGGITALGVTEWDWGDTDFHINNEGWFGMNTGSGGVDKLGHMYSSYLIAEILTKRLVLKSRHMPSSARYAGYFTLGAMLYVEIFDGFSADHGFSYEDMTMNAFGVGLSYLRNVYPTFGEKLDFRIAYEPSAGMSGFHPITDYSGMKYIAVLKPAGFDALKNSPLKYLELHTGYYTRGFKNEDRPFTDFKQKNLYVGLGLNFDEVVFKPFSDQLGKIGDFASLILHYYQPPKTFTETKVWDSQKRVN